MGRCWKILALVGPNLKESSLNMKKLFTSLVLNQGLDFTFCFRDLGAPTIRNDPLPCTQARWAHRWPVNECTWG